MIRKMEGETVKLEKTAGKVVKLKIFKKREKRQELRK